MRISEVDSAKTPRIPSGIGEFDRVLGGGLVPGMAVLVGGEPGIGKSTLLLQAAAKWAERGQTVLYVTSEESAQQTKMRAERLNIRTPNLLVLAETNLERITHQIGQSKAGVVVVDSIQMVYKPDLPAAPGSVTQLRDACMDLVYLSKQTGVPVVVVGHVTKAGTLAGPKIIEHIVDTVVYFEGDRYHAHRIVRCVKNRFGGTHEVGLFEMTGRGLSEVADPGKLFAEHYGVGGGENPPSGSVLTAVMQGSRTLLVEVQALTASSVIGAAKRKVSGFSSDRTAMIIAVLEKRADLRLAADDVFVNVAGGVKITEPAADLAVALAISSRPLQPPAAAGNGRAGRARLGRRSPAGPAARSAIERGGTTRRRPRHRPAARRPKAQARRHGAARGPPIGAGDGRPVKWPNHGDLRLGHVTPSATARRSRCGRRRPTTRPPCWIISTSCGAKADFLMFGPADELFTVEQEREWIRGQSDGPDGVSDRRVGRRPPGRPGRASGPTARCVRVRHRATLNISLLCRVVRPRPRHAPDARVGGLGRAPPGATSGAIGRVRRTTRRAAAVYRKCGFAEEGRPALGCDPLGGRLAGGRGRHEPPRRRRRGRVALECGSRTERNLPMPSPFPGMNPYFERRDWKQFHAQFVPQIPRTLNRLMPAHYFAKAQTDVVLREPSAKQRRRAKEPDISIIDRRAAGGGAGAAVAVAPAAEYVTLPEVVVEEKRRWVEIVDSRPSRVVTHVEVLSPSDKRGDRRTYLDKRLRLLHSETNFVEIDLLRGGRRMPMEGLPPCDYCAIVARPEERGRARCWTATLRRPLPSIPIPLRPEDGEVALDLQRLLHETYDEAGFARDWSLYETPPDPPLPAEEAAWAESMVAEVC